MSPKTYLVDRADDPDVLRSLIDRHVRIGSPIKTGPGHVATSTMWPTSGNESPASKVATVQHVSLMAEWVRGSVTGCVVTSRAGTYMGQLDWPHVPLRTCLPPWHTNRFSMTFPATALCANRSPQTMPYRTTLPCVALTLMESKLTVTFVPMNTNETAPE